jgi:lysyl-tRNA synthetase, class II
MLFRITPEIFRDFPGVRVGLVVAYNINNSSQNAIVNEMLKKQQEIIKSLDKDKILSHTYIAAWQDAYRKFGVKPKEYLSSVENLIRRVLKGQTLRSVNTLVDIYNIISLRYMLPAGGEDLDTITGDIRLAIAGNNEPAVKLLGETEERAPKPGEVIYTDDKSAICRRWNWKEADRTKLIKETKNAVLVLEALNPVNSQVLQVATYQLAALVEEFCGGNVTTAILDIDTPEVLLSRAPGEYLPLNPAKKDIEPINIYEINQLRDTFEDHEHASREHEIRIQKVEKLRELGIEPWPPAKEVTATCEQVIQEYKDDEKVRRYNIAGRLMSIRLHGKAAFAQLQDITGRLQIYIKKEIVGDKAFEVFQHLIDLGDIIWCDGYSFKTKTGEITLHVDSYTLLSKCLHPLPEKFHGLTDIEVKYRQRYLDLITSPDTKERFIKRSNIISAIRCFLDSHDYIEVETPMLHPIAGGAAARPFVTHHNALSSDLYLRIAPELYLKRLTVGGLERVYEINRNFRNEGISTRHNPEFTMVEFYTANKDYHYSMDFVEKLLQDAALKACGTLQVPYGELIIDFSSFKRLSMQDAVIKYGNLTAVDLSPEHIDQTFKYKNIKLENKNITLGEKILLLFEELVEAHLIQPTFIIDFPVETSPLAKRDPDNPEIAARYELFIAGMEISNSYNELNDPFDQAERFREQVKAHAAGNVEAHQFDADFIRALEYGLPPAVGVGIGIDRVVMILTNTPSIKEVILFPTLKKKH